MVAGAVLASGSGLAAFDTGRQGFVCPLDGGELTSREVSSYSSLGTPDDELRPMLNGPVYEYKLHVCPRCHYTGFGNHFQSGDRTPTLPECLAVQAALKKHKEARPIRRPETMFPLEKYAVAEVCFLARPATAQELASLYLWAAWVADDAGEDALADAYRRKALPQIEKSTRHAKPLSTDYWWSRYRTAALTQTLRQTRAALEQFRVLAGDLQKIVKEFEAKLSEAKKKSRAWLSDYKMAPEKLEKIQEDVRYLKAEVNLQLTVARFREIGEAKGLGEAQGGDWRKRLAFVKAFAAGKSAAAWAAVRTWLPPQKTADENGWPADDDEEDAEESERQRQEGWLRRRIESTLQKALAFTPGGELVLGRKPKTVKAFATKLKKARAKESDPSEEDWSWGDSAGQIADDTIRSLCGINTPEAGKVLLVDLAENPQCYETFEPIRLANPLKVMALDAAGALKLARGMSAKHAAGKTPAAHVVSALRPLAFADTAESLAFLRQVVNHKQQAIRFAASQCLVIRRRTDGKAVFFREVLRRPRRPMPGFGEEDWRWPEEWERDAGPLASAVVRLVDRADLPTLTRLAQSVTVKKLVPHDPKTTKVITVKPPVWVLAALARIAPKQWADDYEKRFIEELAPPEVKEDAPAKGTAEQIAVENVYSLLCYVDLWCTFRMADWLAKALGQTADAWLASDLIRAMARAKIPQAGRELAKLLGRPTPCRVKLALIAATRDGVPLGLEAKLNAWSRSRNSRLASAAKRAARRP